MRARGTAEAAEAKLRLAIPARAKPRLAILARAKPRLAILAVLLAGMAGSLVAQQMDWRYGRPGVLVTTNEQDKAALRAYHYGSSDIIESPAEWFEFDKRFGSITGFSQEAANKDVIVPWIIEGVETKELDGVMEINETWVRSIVLPKSVTSIQYSFVECYLDYIVGPAVTNVNSSFTDYLSDGRLDLPSVASVEWSFNNCPHLSKITFSASPPLHNDYSFLSCPRLTIYVDNPHAEGWGSTFAGRPVVRLPVTADSYTLPPTTATNMFLRLSASNEFIIVEEVFK